VLVAIIRKRICLHHSLYTILQILSISLFEKTPILQAFAQHQQQTKDPQPLKQLYLQGFLTGQ